MLESIRTLLQEGKYPEALEVCRRLAPQYSHDAVFQTFYGACLVKTNDWKGAEAAFEKAQELDLKLIAPHKNLARLYKARNDPRAFKSLFISQWLDPHDVTTHQELESLGLTKNTYPAADVVFYTGTPFLEAKFSPLSLEEGALGGSETAFVVMARELVRQGKKVICFCNTLEIKEYEGVLYIPVEQFFFYALSHEIPVLVASRFLHPLEQKAPARLKILWLHESYGCARPEEDIGACVDQIDYFFGLSDYQINLITQRFQIPKDKFIKTRNGFIPELFRKNTSGGLSEIIYFSRPERGLKEALQVFSTLKKKKPELILHVCTYTQRNKIEDDENLFPVLDLLKQDGVKFQGHLSKKDLADLLARCRLCLYPNVTDMETSCIVAIEAMAAGCPVVTSDRGALPETVQDGVGGKIVPYRTDEGFLKDLESAASFLLENNQEWEKLSHSARERAFTYYPWKDVAREWMNFFEEKL